MRPVLIEPATEADRNYITSSWMRSYQRSLVGQSLGPAYSTWRLVVGACIEAGSLIVARPIGDSADTILGWLCTEGPLLHYVYVRDTHRGLGIATQLLTGHELTSKTHTMPGKFDALRYVGYRP